MTDELLPPDPSKDGWHWIDLDGRGVAPFLFTAHDKKWCRLSSGPKTGPEEFANWKWTLASEKPIPGPVELDALHALPDEMANEIAITRKLRDLYTLQGAEWRRQETIAAIYERCAAMLRAALGIKP